MVAGADVARAAGLLLMKTVRAPVEIAPVTVVYS
jgi:hypothetical protein